MPIFLVFEGPQSALFPSLKGREALKEVKKKIKELVDEVI
jgi:hypothetical protein